MSQSDIIRAWKDEEYRLGLSADETAQVPPNPAGLVELSDRDLEVAAGGIGQSQNCSSWGNCFTRYPIICR